MWKIFTPQQSRNWSPTHHCRQRAGTAERWRESCWLRGDRIGIADAAGMLAVSDHRQRESLTRTTSTSLCQGEGQVLEAFNRRYISTKLTIHWATSPMPHTGLRPSLFHFHETRRYTKDEK